MCCYRPIRGASTVSTNNSPFQPISIGRVPRDQAYIYWLCLDTVGPSVRPGHAIDDFRGACTVKGNVQVAGRTSSVSTTEMLSTHDITLRNVDVSLFHVQIWFVMGHQDQMGKTEGVFLNLQCDCHRVASMFIKLINHYTNFCTLLPNVTALWINGDSLNSLAHTFVYRTHRPNKQIAVIISNKRKYWKVHIRKQQHLILPVKSKKRQLMRTKTAVSNSSEGSFQWWR